MPLSNQDRVHTESRGRHVLAMSALAVLTACGGPAPVAPSEGSQSVVSEPVSGPVDAETETLVAADAEPAAITPEFAALPTPYNTADYASGRRTFKLCSSCHTLEAGGANGVGPNLHGMFGRAVGALDGFGYSQALSNADFTWTPEHLDAWLANPRTFLEGNRMTFSGVRKPEDRLAVMAYIMLETGYADARKDTDRE